MNTLDAAFHLARACPGGKEALAARLGKSAHTFRHELTGVGTLARIPGFNRKVAA